MSDKKEFHYFVLPEYEEEEQYIRVTELGCYTDPLSIFLYILCTVCLIIYVSLMARCYKGFKRLKEKYDIN